jgi:hypothetical protein
LHEFGLAAVKSAGSGAGHGSPLPGLAFLVVVVGAFLLGRRRGRNQARAKAEAAAIAVAGGGEAGAQAESGVVIHLHAGDDQRVVNQVLAAMGSAPPVAASVPRAGGEVEAVRSAEPPASLPPASELAPVLVGDAEPVAVRR